MGSVFGKETVKEPPFDIILERNTDAETSYELRKYGQRFAASVTYQSKGPDDTSSPFRTLAGYIGVFGTAQNEGSTSIAMTAPVVVEQENEKKPESIAMTAPVVMENNDNGTKKMMFMLPAEYDDVSKIPKPTNPSVHIEAIPSETGAVHRFNGSMNDKGNRQVAKDLSAQLIQDGVDGITEEYVMEHFQFWGYNPPFTIPAFRRNEVWLKLNEDQVTYLTEKFPSVRGRLVGGSSSSMNGRYTFGLATCGLLLGCYAVGYLFKSRGTQYRRL